MKTLKSFISVYIYIILILLNNVINLNLNMEGGTILIISISVCYYLKLRNAIASYHEINFYINIFNRSDITKHK